MSWLTKSCLQTKNLWPKPISATAPPGQRPELFLLRNTYPKKAKSLQHCIPRARVEKHKAHRSDSWWSPTPPILTTKAWEGAQHCSPLCCGRESILSASGLCNSSVHLHPNAPKTGKRDSLFLVVLKIQKGQIRNKKWVRPAIKQDWTTAQW